MKKTTSNTLDIDLGDFTLGDFTLGDQNKFYIFDIDLVTVTFKPLYICLYINGSGSRAQMDRWMDGPSHKDRTKKT